MSGVHLAWNNIKALDLKSKYTVAIPELDFVNAKVEATTESTFLEIAGTEIGQKSRPRRRPDSRPCRFETKFQERTRQVDARGQVIFHPNRRRMRCRSSPREPKASSGRWRRAIRDSVPAGIG